MLSARFDDSELPGVVAVDLCARELRAEFGEVLAGRVGSHAVPQSGSVGGGTFCWKTANIANIANGDVKRQVVACGKLGAARPDARVTANTALETANILRGMFAVPGPDVRSSEGNCEHSARPVTCACSRCSRCSHFWYRSPCQL